MSARKINNTDCFDGMVMARSGSIGTHLEISTRSISLHRNGIEFRSDAPIRLWTEMTVDLETSSQAKKVSCTGTIVSCSGSEQTGYIVSMVFTGLSRQDQAQLNSMTLSA